MNDRFKTIFGRNALRKLNELADRANVTGERVQTGPGGTVILPPPRQYIVRPFPWGSDHPWGLVSVSGATATIAAGEFEVGAGTPLETIQTTFTITADAQYIGLQYNPETAALSLISPTQSKPISADGMFRTWLYFFEYTSPTATYIKHNLTGGWHGALFAAATQ